jgi:aerobic-type carbon monoxide dehydrogenase small subunit (CoxS/CutS family)
MKERKDGLSRRDFLGVAGALGAAAGLGSASARAEDGENRKGPAGIGPGAAEVSLTVNGAAVKVVTEPRATLLDVLRDDLGLTGAKKACDRGECGACTVHVDGRAVYACMLPVLHARGRDVRTVEGLSSGDDLHPVQAAFIEHDGYQCGFCTPGQVMATAALLKSNPGPSLDEVKAGLCGNLCRCAAYNKIFEAALAAAKAK